MKLLSLFLFAACLQVSARTSAQTITFKGEEISLQKALAAVKQQTGYVFIIDGDLLSRAKSISIDVKDVSLETFLQIALRDQQMDYVIKKKTVVISAKNNSDSNNLKKNEDQRSASSLTISGKVNDSDGGPLLGATITNKTSKNSTSSNAEGRFTLNANAGDVISISYVGYLGISIRLVQGSAGALTVNIVNAERQSNNGIENAENHLPIDNKLNRTSSAFFRSSDQQLLFTLLKKSSDLEEVVVKTNYYSTTKRLSTGNISKVTSKEIGNQPVVSPLLALQGRVPGLEITTPVNSTPGIAPTIRIRGNNSLRISGKNNTNPNNDGNYPLYIVDGVPVSSIPVFTTSGGSGELTVGGYDPLSTISPESIESIEILKDADATAIYGSRGANGVILITTKVGLKNINGTDLDVNAYTGVGQINSKLKLLGTEQYLMMRREALFNDGAELNNKVDFDLLYWDSDRETDWQDVLTGGTANVTDIQTSVSSGNQNTTFRLGGGFHKETLVYPGEFGYYRISGQLSVNHVSRNNKFRMTTNINYGLDNNKLFTETGAIGSRLRLPPNAPKLYNDDGSLNWELHNIDGVIRNTWVNPLSYLRNTSLATGDNLVSNANFSYLIARGVSMETSVGYTRTLTNETWRRPGEIYPVINGLLDTVYRSRSFFLTDAKNSSWIVEPKLYYVQKNDRHELNVTVGTTFQRSMRSYYAVQGSNYTSDIFLNSLQNAGRILITSDEQSEYKYASLYGRVGYNFKQKYLINITGRSDGSSRFGPNNKFGTFGAFGIGWVFSEENSIQQALPFLSFGKFRGSFGITGSDAVQDYRFYDLYRTLPQTLIYQGALGIVPDALYNPDFKWEKTVKAEAAIELGFYENRFGFELSWYRNRTANQLIDYKLSQITGFPSIIKNFNAVVENHGWEGVFRASILNSLNIKWNMSFNISIPKNKLARFDGIESTPYLNSYKVGEPLSIRFLYLYKGVNPESGYYEFEDLNNDGLLNQLDRRLIHSMDRQYYGGINNTFQYKFFDISFLLQFSKQPNLRNLPAYPGNIYENQTVEAMTRWFANGDATNVPKFSANRGLVNTFNLYGNLQQSTYNIDDASFIRLKSLSINYTLKNSFLRRLKVKQAKLFIHGQNLFTITSYSGLDPETPNGIPPLRMFTGGFQLKI